MIRKYQEASSVASRSRIFVWNGLFGVTEISLEIDVKSVKPKDHLWIFMDFRPATSASKVQNDIHDIHIACMLPPGLQQRTSTVSIFKDIFWPLLLKPLAELHVMGQQDPYLPEHPDCSPLS